MANYDLPNYNTSDGGVAKGYQPDVRFLERYVDLAPGGDVTMTTATDTVDWFQLPAGSVVLAGTIEQITAGAAGNTLTLRVGTTAISAALASDAVAGTIVAGANAGTVVTAASDVNILSGTAARVTGKIRLAIWFCEGKRPFGEPGLARRTFI